MPSTSSLDETFEWIDGLVGGGVLPGVAVGLDLDGRRTVRAFGHEIVRSEHRMTPATRFPIGCISKSLLALQCVEAHLRGRLDIHAPIARLLTERIPGGPGETITVAHILSHSCGYVEPHGRGAFSAMTWDRLVQGLTGETALTPGRMWSYTQTAHAIAAEILTQVTGRSPFDGFKADFFDPLGIGPADISSKAENLRGCASFHIYSNAQRRYEPVRIADIGPFFRAAIADAPLSVGELLALGKALDGLAETAISREAIALARRPHVRLARVCTGSMAELVPDSYGYGAGQFGDYWAATGSYSGSSCAIRSCPPRKAVIALGMNAWAPGLRDQILARLMTAVGGYERPSGAVEFDAPEEELEGEYEGLMLNSGALRVARNTAGLQCVVQRPTGESRFQLARRPAGRYVMGAGGRGETIGFECAPDTSRTVARLGFGLYRRRAA